MTNKVSSHVLSDTAVSTGTYGGTTQHAVFTVDSQGRLTYAANATPSVATSQLTGTINALQVANNQTYGVNITGSSGSTTGNAGTVTNGVYSVGNQTITGTKTFNSKIIGSISGNADGNAGTVTNGVYTNGSYADPAWITSLSKSKVGLGNVDNTADANKSVSYASTAGSAPASDVYSWAKASTKPSYSKSEVGLGNVDNTADANKVVLRSGNGCKAWVIFDGTVNATAGDQYCTVIASYNIESVVKRGTSFWANMTQSVNYNYELGGYLGVIKVTQMYNSYYPGTVEQQMSPQYTYSGGFVSTSQAGWYVSYPTNRILVEVWW